MSILRPIGHIAGNLSILAVSIVYRLRLAPDGQTYAAWVDDDGCVYLALTHHPRATAMLRCAREQRVNTYRKPRGAAFPLLASDISDDLRDARAEWAQRAVDQAALAAA